MSEFTGALLILLLLLCSACMCSTSKYIIIFWTQECLCTNNPTTNNAMIQDPNRRRRIINPAKHGVNAKFRPRAEGGRGGYRFPMQYLYCGMYVRVLSATCYHTTCSVGKKYKWSELFVVWRGRRPAAQLALFSLAYR